MKGHHGLGRHHGRRRHGRHHRLGVPGRRQQRRRRRHHDWTAQAPVLGGAAAGLGVAGASVAAAGYVGWSMIRTTAAVRRSVTSVAEVVEDGAKKLDSQIAKPS